MKKITLTLFCLLLLQFVQANILPANSVTTNLDVSCTAPTNLTVANITTTEVDLSWDVASTTAAFYQYCIVTDGVAVAGPTTTDGTVTAASTTDTGSYDLLPNTAYEVFIRSFCVDENTGETAWSNWSAGVSFTTAALPSCAAPTNLAVSNITATDVDVSWDVPTSLPMFYQYCIVTDGIPVDGPSTSDGSVISANAADGGYALLPETTYEVFIRSVCMGDSDLEWGDWSAGVSFTTAALPSCAAPTNLAVSNVTATDVDLSWDVASTSSLFYQYCIVTDGVPTVGPSTSDATTVTASTTDESSYDLLPETTYEVYIRSFCLDADAGTTEWSEWSSAVSFTTATLGVGNQTFKSLQVYPNPATSVINITNGTTNISAVEMYNVLGEKVLAKNCNSTHVLLDINNLKKGFYLLTIVSGTEKNTIKVVKE